MPHLGQLPGLSLHHFGCMGQVYWVAADDLAALSGYNDRISFKIPCSFLKFASVPAWSLASPVLSSRSASEATNLAFALSLVSLSAGKVFGLVGQRVDQVADGEGVMMHVFELFVGDGFAEFFFVLFDLA